MEEQKIIRVFARKTKMSPDDDLAFFDGPPLYNLPDLPVYVSVTFSWDIKWGYVLKKEWEKRFKKEVFIHGPAFSNLGLKNYFIPGRFLRNGITITSRGCNKRCPWCKVWYAEGRLKEINIAPGHVIQDNNILACSRTHIEKVFDMLRQQRKGAIFSGGLDIDYLQAWHVDLLKSIKIGESGLCVACDCEKDLKRLDKARDLLSDFPIKKKRCYVLVGFDGDTPESAERRCEKIYDNDRGFMPFAQYYQPARANRRVVPKEWRYVVWKYSRPAAYRSKKTL